MTNEEKLEKIKSAPRYLMMRPEQLRQEIQFKLGLIITSEMYFRSQLGYWNINK